MIESSEYIIICEVKEFKFIIFEKLDGGHLNIFMRLVPEYIVIEFLEYHMFVVLINIEN